MWKLVRTKMHAFRQFLPFLIKPNHQNSLSLVQAKSVNCENTLLRLKYSIIYRMSNQIRHTAIEHADK